MKSDFKDSLEFKNLKHYIQQISQFPTLTFKDEKELGKLIQKGDKNALKKLVESNLRFVVSYVKKYTGMGLSLLELIHEGNLGLIEAAQRYDPRRNVKFISYAVWWIRQAVIHALTQQSRIYRIPQKLSDRISEMKRARSHLKKELDREPTREEVARYMGLSRDELEDLEILSERDVSLSDKYYDDESVEIGDRIEDKMFPSVEYKIIKNAIQKQIREMLQELDDKESFVLKSRFGLEDDEPKTLQGIGNRLNLTRERIRQIEQKGMKKLARSHKLQQLRGYLN
ncbi:RNA polymerase sigma factor RpoD/SigA [bacterium]|nr:RNA polymerase sigma factor RpoD/SigA [bacterium]